MLAIAALFLPLFPLSVVLNLVLARVRAPLGRAVLLLLWPQLGVLLLANSRRDVPDFVVAWAWASAAFYALRLLTVRELGLWAGFLASSALALLWPLAAQETGAARLHASALWLTLPAALLVLLTGPLTARLGAAYAGLCAGFADTLPRLAGVLTALVLGAIATPPFPGFFVLLELLHGAGAAAAFALLAIWLVWGWAATRVLQGFVAGPGRVLQAADLGRGSTLAYAAALGAFALAGLYATGGGL